MFNRLNISQKQKMHMGMIISEFLDLSSKDFWKMVKELEEDPLFFKLNSFPASGMRAIHINPRRLYLDLDESLKSYTSVWQENIENYLERRADLVKKLKGLGPDKFTTLFLSGDASLPELSEITGLCIEDIKEFQKKVLDAVFIEEQFSADLSSAIQLSHDDEVVGIVETVNDEPVFQPVQEKERYTVYNWKLETFIKSKILDEDEILHLPDFLRKINYINMRLNLVSLIVKYLVSVQRNYIISAHESDIVPIEGKDVASYLGINPGWFSRLIKNKMIKTVWGTVAVKQLLLTRKRAKQNKGKQLLLNILQEHKGKRPSDRILCNEIFERYGMKVSRRTVNLWRRELVE